MKGLHHQLWLPCITNLPPLLLPPPLPPLVQGSLRFTLDAPMNMMERQRWPKPGWTLSASTSLSTKPSTMTMTGRLLMPCHTWRKGPQPCGLKAAANKALPTSPSGLLSLLKLLRSFFLIALFCSSLILIVYLLGEVDVILTSIPLIFSFVPCLLFVSLIFL